MAWDFSYINSNPANQNAPATDQGVNDPNFLSNELLRAFEVTDQFSAGNGQVTSLVIAALGGAITNAQVYIWSKSANAWILWATGLNPGPATAPARVAVPVGAKVFIRLVDKGTATAVYAGFSAG